LTSCVVSKTVVDGYHRWPEARAEHEYLSFRHRHLFYVRCWWTVSHDDRDIEFIEASRSISSFFEKRFGKPAELGSMSCEQICKTILDEYPSVIKVSCYEDDENGAEVERD
jgi:hypothetical protein